jgi:GntR family transcriptional regulator of arabinose operon
MMTSATAPVTKPGTGNTRPTAKFEQVLLQLETLCSTLQTGDRIPALPELMRQFQASERAVLRALDELQRAGRIIRRHGAGTFIAEPLPPSAPIPTLATTDQQGIVAVRIPDNSFFDRCLDVLFQHTDALNIPLICRIVGKDVTAEAADMFVPATGAENLSFLFFRYDLAPLAKRLQDKGCRVVIVGATPTGVIPEVPCVYGDHEQGGYLVTRHLVENNHRRIAFHASGPDYTENLRWEGHQRALSEAARSGVSLTPIVLPDTVLLAWRADPEQARVFLRQPDAPTAIVCWNDHEATRLMVALNAAGIRVPDDVSVIGYDNLPEGQLVQPPLSTVDHSIDWQIRTAVELLRRPVLPIPSHTKAVMPTLIPRGSTGPAPQ